MAWLQSRMTASSKGELARSDRVPGGDIRTASSTDFACGLPRFGQQPRNFQPSGTGDASLLTQLVSLTPTGFEAAVVLIFRELDEVRHNITRTRPTADGGFDFVGSFTLPPPIQYEIPFLGEAKRYARTTAVGPKDVSRLVARLARGQYGIFVTTSYFTKQTQEEVLEDRYPTTLVAGADLVRIMREMRIARGSEISPIWLASVQREVETDRTEPSRGGIARLRTRPDRRITRTGTKSEGPWYGLPHRRGWAQRTRAWPGTMTAGD